MPVVRVVAASAEDEARLLAWAWRSADVRQLGLRLLDALAAYEERRAQ